MFENFENAKHTKMPAWAMPLIIASIAIHLIVFTGMWIKAMWAIEKLDVPKGEIGIALAAPQPPPPAPPPGGKKPDTPKEKKPRKIKVQEPVQPTQLEEKPQETTTSDVEDPNGVEGGEEGGQIGGIEGGIKDAPPPPPPPKPVATPPRNVAPTALEAQRIGGEKNIIPDDVTKTEIQRAGKTKIVASVKICLNGQGSVASLSLLKPSGFPAYDQKIQREMRNWRYRPFMINGKPAPVCTAVTFIYQQRS